MSWAEVAATSLENERVLLRPVRPEDRAPLHAIAMDPDIWRYFVLRIETDADFDAFFDLGIADQQAGRRVVYCITDKRTGRTAGSTSFFNMSEADGRRAGGIQDRSAERAGPSGAAQYWRARGRHAAQF